MNIAHSRIKSEIGQEQYKFVQDTRTSNAVGTSNTNAERPISVFHRLHKDNPLNTA